MVQEKGLGQGAQDNESAVEQAKDEQISVGVARIRRSRRCCADTDCIQDFIRDKYKSATGSDIPIKDKATALDKTKD